MNNKQVDMLLENAQKIYINELKYKINELEKLFAVCKDCYSESDIKQMLMFFHSLNGTASTLRLDYLSSVGREWEARMGELTVQEPGMGKQTLCEAQTAINAIKEKIVGISNGSTINIVAESQEYVNMPDRGKILLIDDDIAILKLLENAFTREGYKVYICEDSASAMDTVALTRPDVVILDILMPRVSGYEILESIKSKPEYSDMAIIFLSAKGYVDDRIKGLKSGADDYITKPFIIGEVLTRVEMIMRRSNNYKEKLLKDSLTDAYSRYYFNLRIAEELERFRRNGTLFSLAFIDMDHYKLINDQYGHQTGDHVLKELVSSIAANIRRCDSIYRYGGEEFVILFPDTGAEKAAVVLDRLREGFGSQPVSVGSVDLHVTFSAGIRQVGYKDDTVEQLISDADKAMYQAKKCGRNRVVIYNSELKVDRRKKTILIVDDENTILRLLKDRLSSVGYDVLTAKDGRDAITLVEKEHPDAVLLDLVLPDINGFEVCRQIKEKTPAKSVKIIMLSKRKQKTSVVKGLNSGADDYITKPFSMAELEARIRKVLNNAC